jgi:pSer/pThr/pTyr-binding forkhead associated (FHA) protein
MGEVIFTVIEGEDKDKQVRLHFGSCKVVGRNLDTNTTVHTGTTEDKIELRQKEIERVKSYLIRYDSQKFYSKEIDFKENEMGSYSRTADFILLDDAISRVHAMVFFGEEGVGIVDLASTNGTFVDEKKINLAELKDNSVIKIGETKIKVELPK